ncbi:hypothetical protein BSKO_01044 [Bryopsis sp. KO-2023]|nr:hypothetical protein BSKO_01044 [Bryopsis sp. KO-2023]
MGRSAPQKTPRQTKRKRFPPQFRGSGVGKKFKSDKAAFLGGVGVKGCLAHRAKLVASFCSNVMEEGSGGRKPFFSGGGRGMNRDIARSMNAEASGVGLEHARASSGSVLTGAVRGFSEGGEGSFLSPSCAGGVSSWGGVPNFSSSVEGRMAFRNCESAGVSSYGGDKGGKKVVFGEKVSFRFVDQASVSRLGEVRSDMNGGSDFRHGDPFTGAGAPRSNAGAEAAIVTSRPEVGGNFGGNEGRVSHQHGGVFAGECPVTSAGPSAAAETTYGLQGPGIDMSNGVGRVPGRKPSPPVGGAACVESNQQGPAPETSSPGPYQKSISKWLDSLPELVPGAFLFPDDDFDKLPFCLPPPNQDSSEPTVAEHRNAEVLSNLPRNISRKKPIVFVWDLDETLILSTSLTSGQYAHCNRDLDVKRMEDLGTTWSKAVYYVAEKHLFSKQVRNNDKTTLAEMAPYDDGMDLSFYDFNTDLMSGDFNEEGGARKLAYRYRKITEFYKMGLENTNVGKYVPFWRDLFDKTDAFCKGWLTAVRSLLEGSLMADRDVTHVIVTAGCLVPSLAKVMLFQWDKYFPCENVYSSHPSPDGKFTTFRTVKQRFGSDCTYCAIGDGPYEELAAAENGWPFIRIALAQGAPATVGASGGNDSLGRLASTPMDLTAEDLIEAADTDTPVRHRDEVGLRFRESTRKQNARAARAAE